MTSAEALAKLENIKFDFIYIDGNHQYKFVKYDIENYFKLLNKSGYLIGYRNITSNTVSIVALVS